MAWHKKQQEEEQKKPARKGIFKRILLFSGLGIMAVAIALLGACAWLTQTRSGLSFVQNTANSFLQKLEPPAFTISDLQGSIPFDFSFGITSSDERGLWLNAPENRIIWNWRKLPGAIEIKQISAAKVDMQRIPVLPPANHEAEKIHDQPVTVKDIQDLLAQVSDFLSASHWWLPAIVIESIELSSQLPESLLVASGDDLQRLGLDASATLSFLENKAKAGLRAQLRNTKASQIYLPSLDVDLLSLDLSANAGPEPDGIKAGFDLGVELLKPRLQLEDFPEDMLGENAQLKIKLDGAVNSSASAASLELTGPNLDAGNLSLKGDGKWQSNEAWTHGEFSGPVQYDLAFGMLPIKADLKSPLAAFREPLDLKIALAGILPKLDLDVDLGCANIEEKGYAFKDTRLTLSARDVSLPYTPEALAMLERENHIDFTLASFFEKQKISLLTKIFFQGFPSGQREAWRIGLRDLSMQALGLTGTGNMAALLAADRKPALDGSLKLAIDNWSGINNFLADQKVAGNVNLNILLSSGLPKELCDPAAPLDKVDIQESDVSQMLSAVLEIPKIGCSSSKSQLFSGSGISGSVILRDIFNDLDINADLRADKLLAAGLDFKANLHTDGKIKGPLNLELGSQGSVNSRIAAQWSPGMINLKTLDAVADLSRLLGKKGRMLAGAKTAGPSRIEYGERGLRISDLDMLILPAGRLQARGGMAPEKLDLRINLEGLEFKPWQALVPPIPAGVASLNANLSGTPKKPAGNFKLSVAKLAVPGVNLAPVSFSLTGAIEQGRAGSVFNSHLDLDPSTVKTLGGKVAQITASLPLAFTADGIPRPNMKEPFHARVRWEGAIGPLWNLVPVADMRVNGGLNLDLEALGNLEKPNIRGHIFLNDARYENVLYGILLTAINLKLDLLDGGKLASKGSALPGAVKMALSLSDGRGGELVANGEGSLDGKRLDIKTRLKDLRPLRRRDIHIELSGHADVSGSAFAPVIAGEIIVDKGEVLLNNLEMTGSVTTLPISTTTQIPPAQPRSSNGVGKLNVRVRMLPRFSVEGRGLASIWQANLLVAGTLTDPQVTGNISCVRGNFDFLGKIFALTRGVVFFGGGSISNPLVDIDLTHETPDLTAHILVTGPVNKIRIRLSSDPTVPRDEILSRVLFGRSVNELSRMEALQLAGAVAQLAGFGGGSGPLGLAKKALGVDVLRIGTANTGSENQTNEETGGGTTVEMGKYINDYIYMGVQQGFKADSTAFIIEIEITPRTNFELRTDQSNTWGGIKWKYNY